MSGDATLRAPHDTGSGPRQDPRGARRLSASWARRAARRSAWPRASRSASIARSAALHRSRSASISPSLRITGVTQCFGADSMSASDSYLQRASAQDASTRNTSVPLPTGAVRHVMAPILAGNSYKGVHQRPKEHGAASHALWPLCAVISTRYCCDIAAPRWRPLPQLAPEPKQTHSLVCTQVDVWQQQLACRGQRQQALAARVALRACSQRPALPQMRPACGRPRPRCPMHAQGSPAATCRQRRGSGDASSWLTCFHGHRRRRKLGRGDAQRSRLPHRCQHRRVSARHCEQAVATMRDSSSKACIGNQVPSRAASTIQPLVTHTRTRGGPAHASCAAGCGARALGRAPGAGEPAAHGGERAGTLAFAVRRRQRLIALPLTATTGFAPGPHSRAVTCSAPFRAHAPLGAARPGSSRGAHEPGRGRTCCTHPRARQAARHLTSHTAKALP
jgi:hypothetical protein